MDASEAVEVIKDRISRLESEYVAKKIIGFIYFQGISDHEMIRLALGPDAVIHNLIQKAKSVRLLSPQPVISPPISPTINPTAMPDPSYQFGSYSPALSPHPFSPATSPHSFPALRKIPPYWDPRLATEHHPPQPPMHNQSFKIVPYSEPIPEEYGLPNQYMALEDPLEVVIPGETVIQSDYYGLDDAFNHLSIRGSRNSSLMDFPVKTCHYFNKGYCKHGNNCRFFHVEASPESYPHQMFGLGPYEDDQVFSPGTLEKIEAEITELLRSSRGSPVSIASLPMMYYEKYGKTLQAEGYLTESQRHGKAGYSLTKLLARLKNSIRLIDRPHGQHAVILAEDAPKHMDIRGERNDPGPIVNGSCQIYLTFPAESAFSEEDVSNYFSSYGKVEDVRIPCQQKRMFGFVTFASAETVKRVLSMGKPHDICGARVLVKPYREKSKLVERKYLDKFDHPVYYHAHLGDIDSELASWQSSRHFRRQPMEAQKWPAPEVEALRFSQLQLACKPVPFQSSFGYPMDDLKDPQDHLKFPSKEHFNYLLEAFNSGSATASGDNPPMHSANNCGDQESGQGLSLPDSPFTSTVGCGIPAVI